MLRRLIMTLVLSVAPLAVAAQSVEDSIVAQLRQQGFTEIKITHTLLGRVRIDATSKSLYREVVFNPTTGEVLRDYWRQLSTGDEVGPILIDPSAGGSSDNSSSKNVTTGSNTATPSQTSSEDHSTSEPSEPPDPPEPPEPPEQPERSSSSDDGGDN
ncbi:MAG: hypothetical protein GC146_02125 [Limimaricola sp.]|uniref:hypothetical protein n=1 Tax=Limimaricola sp. TaxID=2211665 RepID=UPI001D810883|nr:hypothetical protein [Limimaricola sp.]MBI1415995.1 hypothetical protein [Limimaricola sp.]